MRLCLAAPLLLLAWLCCRFSSTGAIRRVSQRRSACRSKKPSTTPMHLCEPSLLPSCSSTSMHCNLELNTTHIPCIIIFDLVAVIYVRRIKCCLIPLISLLSFFCLLFDKTWKREGEEQHRAAESFECKHYQQIEQAWRKDRPNKQVMTHYDEDKAVDREGKQFDGEEQKWDAKDSQVSSFSGRK